MEESSEHNIESFKDKNENDSKYKNLFDKYKDNDGLMSKNGLNKILNACGIESTIDQSEQLIKRINRDDQNEKLNLNKFTELMESDNIIDINNKQTLSIITFIIVILILISSGIDLFITTRKLPKFATLGTLFVHNQFLIFCMFLGQAICLLVYFSKLSLFKKNNENIEEPKKPISYLYFLILAILSVIANNLKIFIFAYLLPSIQQMFLSNLFILTFIVNFLYLKKKYYRHHFLSICIIILGVTIYGLNDLINDKRSDERTKIGLGISLYILAQILTSFYFSLEEKILKEYDYDPLKLAGIEGLIGVIIYSILLLLFQNISCNSWSEFTKYNFCVINDDANYHIEDTTFAFNQIFNRTAILVHLIFYIFGVILYNCSRLIIIKNISNIFYLTVDSIRRILFFIIIFLIFKSEYYYSKAVYEKFIWIVFLGFGLLLLGGLIFFEIIIIPFAGLGYYTKKAFKKRQNDQLLNMNI